MNGWTNDGDTPPWLVLIILLSLCGMLAVAFTVGQDKQCGYLRAHNPAVYASQCAGDA